MCRLGIMVVRYRLLSLWWGFWLVGCRSAFTLRTRQPKSISSGWSGSVRSNTGGRVNAQARWTCWLVAGSSCPARSLFPPPSSPSRCCLLSLARRSVRIGSNRRRSEGVDVSDPVSV
ncbi:hypothetical protein BZA05DRAFT_402674 [Tricharina praecox]|uniref:uncharacterized protein n=1 Tax=Tricharina praecox TaxID=43433 RepID=UPI00221FC865|nr:uncharacterized protein BZA05DRAFT_402674 [Tricharina praecox]KAI5849248.1 hypothetical protein BZA05DRAFT_402674 [Tricharina praecox]